MSLLRRLLYKSRKFYDDDFDWDNYTADSYARRIKRDIETEFQAVIAKDQVTFDPDTGRVSLTGTGMHPNHLLILEAIGQLQPKSVHEIGCGGGDHVANGATAFPAITFSGGDRGQSQLDMAKERHGHLAGNSLLQDITMPMSRHWPRAELVFSQAVLMHIHTAVSHFVGLANMVNMSDRYVLLMENYQCHNFVAEVRALHAEGHIDWPQLYIYRFDGSTGARAILLSNQKLDREELSSDEEMREGLVPSERRLKRCAEESARATYGPPK